jgi:site-specific recombinase XerD
MVAAMLLAGLRRCEVLGLRFADMQVADRRLAVVAGKGGHHRVVPAMKPVFDASPHARTASHTVGNNP